MTATLTSPTLLTTPLASPTPAAMPELYRLSVAQYEAMIDAGLFVGESLELIDGLLVKKMPQNPPHAFSLSLTKRQIERRLPDDWHTRIQAPISVPGGAPEPDLVVVNMDERTLGGRHPTASDIALLVEIADTSLAYDTGFKVRLYAAVRVPVYWVVDVVNRVVLVYTDPRGSGDAADYATVHTYRTGDTVPFTVTGVGATPVPVADLLP